VKKNRTEIHLVERPLGSGLRSACLSHGRRLSLIRTIIANVPARIVRMILSEVSKQTTSADPWARSGTVVRRSRGHRTAIFRAGRV
jgi:hypothetical protein